MEMPLRPPVEVRSRTRTIPVRFGVRQRPEQQAVHKTEHRRIRADRQRDGGNRDSGEARVVAQQSKGVAEIVKHAEGPSPDATAKDAAAQQRHVTRPRGIVTREAASQEHQRKRGSRWTAAPTALSVMGLDGPRSGRNVRQPVIARVRVFTSGTGIAGISISSTPFLKVATASSAFTCSGTPTRR